MEVEEELKIVLTKDGSPTVYDPAVRAHFHSVHGARAEALHVYLGGSGLSDWLKAASLNREPVRILEIGFGTGLNFVLTALLAAQHPAAQVQFTSFDVRLLRADILNAYYAHLPEVPPELRQVVQAAGGRWQNSTLEVVNASWADEAATHAGQYDIIFFDAFAPKVATDLWKAAVFTHTLQRLKPTGVLVTYSVSGDIKRLLRKLGHSFKRLPGFGWKWEMLRVQGRLV